MVRGRRQSTGRAIPTGWAEPGGDPTGRADPQHPPMSPAPAAPGGAALADTATRARPAPPKTRLLPPRAGPERSQLHRAAGVLTTLALLALALPWLLLQNPAPEDAARDYLDALISGDLAPVLDHLDAEDGALTSALTATLRDATPARITDYTIHDVAVRGASARVRVTLRTAEESHVQLLHLHATAQGPLSGLRWDLAPLTLPLLTLGPRASTDAVVLNGQRIEIPPVEWIGRRATLESVALHVLPGRYAVELPAEAGPLLPRVIEVHVPPVLGQWQAALIAVDYQLHPDHEDRARATILDALSACLDTGLARPEGCPMGVALPAETPGRWDLVQQPEITYSTMLGSSFDFRGRGLVAEFLPEDPQLEREQVTVDFGVTLHRTGEEFTVGSWGYTTMRPVPR